MRIVEINEGCGIGSTGSLSLDLSREAIRQGNEVFFAYANKDSFKLQKSTRVGNTLEHYFHAFDSRITGKQGYASHFSTIRLLHQFQRFAPDVVNLHNLHGNYINLKLLFSYLAKYKIPTVITLHDSWFYTGKCTHYFGAGCTKWKTNCGSCPLLHKDNVNPTWLFDRTSRCLNDKKKWFSALPFLYVVGVSEWITNEAKQSFLKENASFTTIYNWVDSQIFKPTQNDFRRKTSINGEKIILMVSSTISRPKSYDEMIYLASKITASQLLVVVGSNPEKLPIPKNVIYLGEVSDKKRLADLYSSADVVVNTTQFETFGLVTAEALSCGTPAIVYNSTGSAELVNEHTGMKTNKGDGMDAIYRAVNTILFNTKSFYYQNCLNSAKALFGKEQNVEKYIEIYKKAKAKETW